MPPKLHIGCCGWSYLNRKSFSQIVGTPAGSVLQAYARLFETVEVNSTFYGLPKVSTAEKWRRESAEVRPDFHFTVKAYQGITHIDRFGSRSTGLFERVSEICAALSAKVVLFQSPASFGPSAANTRKLKTFFSTLERHGLILTWEPRGKWQEVPTAVSELCGELNLVHCVDPFRQEPLAFGKDRLAYFRLHGFGKPSMYRYDFSDKELERLCSIIAALPASLRDVYVFFNNVSCYENALEFMKRVV